MYAATQGLLGEIKLRDDRIARLETGSMEQEVESKTKIEELKAELRALREEVRGNLPPQP